MFDSKKTANEIMKTFDSLEKEEQNRILSNCGLSFQKKQRLSTNNSHHTQASSKPAKKKTILIKILKPKKI